MGKDSISGSSKRTEKCHGKSIADARAGGLDCRRRRIKKLGMYPGHPTGLESAGRPRRSSATARARHKWGPAAARQSNPQTQSQKGRLDLTPTTPIIPKCKGNTIGKTPKWSWQQLTSNRKENHESLIVNVIDCIFVWGVIKFMISITIYRV